MVYSVLFVIYRIMDEVVMILYDYCYKSKWMVGLIYIVEMLMKLKGNWW